MEADLKDFFDDLGADLPLGHDGVKMDVGHVIFSRLGPKLDKTTACYGGQHGLQWQKVT